MSTHTDESLDPTSLAASASGKNTFAIACPKQGQRMLYAACLSRREKIDNRQDYPKDWSVCDTNECPARALRAEERAAGKSLYFVAREAFSDAVVATRKWVTSFVKPQRVKTSAPASDMFAAMGAAADLSGAISIAPKAVAAPATAPRKPTGPIPVALPGETPLQMARRIAAERQSRVTP